MPTKVSGDELISAASSSVEIARNLHVEFVRLVDAHYDLIKTNEHKNPGWKEFARSVGWTRGGGQGVGRG
jgi:hypothetical protein